MALILTGSSGLTTLDSSAGLTFSDSSNQQYAAGPYVLKNKLINGAMVIDQRNAGASVTIPINSTTYTLDRWNAYSTQASKFTVQQTPSATETGYATRIGAGFTNYLACTSSASTAVGTTDYYVINQRVEGLNISDLAWGTSNAKTVTLSAWVYSSLTGTFGGAIQNNNQDRSYPFSFTISSANTWTQISITITGDTTGTWLTTNGIGMRVFFNLGSGSTYSGTAGAWAGTAYFAPTSAVQPIATSGATFYITGVQLEVGSTATPFERRLYNQELANCQRYYETSASAGTAPADGVYSFASSGANANSSAGLWYSYHWISFKVNKRIATPTMTFYGSSGNLQWLNNGTWTTLSSVSVPTSDSTAVQSDSGVTFRAGTTGSQYNAIYLRGTWTSSAEL